MTSFYMGNQMVMKMQKGNAITCYTLIWLWFSNPANFYMLFENYTIRMQCI